MCKGHGRQREGHRQRMSLKEQYGAQEGQVYSGNNTHVEGWTGGHPGRKGRERMLEEVGCGETLHGLT